MAYGEGRSLLYRDMGQERADELSRYNLELSAAEDAYEQDVAGATAWQTLGSFVGAIIGGYGGGPKGALKGWQVGGEAGKWGRRGVGKVMGTDYDPADYAITTDAGKFDVSQKYDFEDVNRQFESADRSRFWQDVTGTGKTVGSMLAFEAKGVDGDDWFTKLFGSDEVPAITNEQMTTYYDDIKQYAASQTRQTG